MTGNSRQPTVSSLARPLAAGLTVLVLSFAAPGSGTAAEAEETAQALVREAQAALKKGDRTKALALAMQAIQRDPQNPDPFLIRARLYDWNREYAKALADFTEVLRLQPRAAEAYQERGCAHFKLGQINESLTDFDRFLALVPDRKPYHWQRGISCYYAGRYEEGREQFELHQTVNPQDVENAVWHFLCVARLSGRDQARSSLISITADPRVPMKQVHALFAGKATPEEVLAAAETSVSSPLRRQEQLFYAHLYLGLYFDATQDAKRAREHVFKAAGEFKVDHYMGDVARVHAELLRKPN